MRLSLILTIVTAFATLLLIPFVVGSPSVFWAFVISVIFALVLLIDALVTDGGRRRMLIPSMVLGYSTVVVPSLATLLVFVEEFNFFRDWYKPIMLSSYAALFLTNLMFLPLAAANYSREEKSVAGQAYFPPVSVIVPAYNEEKWIGHCIEALLENDYPSKEIIVVDDGSTDRTYEIASRYVRRGVTVLRKPNGGKASALNYGMLFATGEIIVTVDADSILTRDTLRWIVMPFRDEKVVGVAGNVMVVNRENWLTKNQALEYVTQLNIARRATSFLGVVQVMPGPLAAFRRSMAATLGGYDRITLTEDFDLTVKLLKTGGVIQAPPGAFAFTEAPARLRDLYRQRLRWYRGNTQVLIRHSDAFRIRRYGRLSQLVFPLMVLQQIVIPVLGVAAIPAAILIILAGGLGYVLRLFAVFSVLQLCLSLIALDIQDEDVRLGVYAPFAVVGYKHLLDIIALKAVFDILVLRRKPKWTRAEKKGLEATVRS